MAAQMKTIKPRDVFNRLPECGWRARLVSCPMPQGPYDGSNSMCTLLEMFLLVALAREVNAKYIFEFGTGRGETTQMLAWNTRAQVVTLDLEDVVRGDRIVQVVGDSRVVKLDRDLFGIFDLVFVDGGHDPVTFGCDSRTARNLVRPGGYVVWHDCGNPEFPWIEETLAPTAIRIASTMLAVEGL
jgi:hypothetical protein